ncbi:MAG TPA: tetratricopeptide repeat protein [Anaerolineales bacterium]|nr:tetratricopeptide repeat protein [Anaerolineales bacterium]
MNRRRRPFNYFKIFALVAAIAATLYFSLYISPTIQQAMLPTPTPTRSPDSIIAEAEQALADGKLTQGIELYQQAVVLIPNEPKLYIEMAKGSMWLGDPAKAQTEAENALLLNPNNSTAHAVRGWALSSQGNYLDAESSLKRALEIDPNNALAHSYYAEMLTDIYLSGNGALDTIDLMREESRVALSLGPGMFETHRARGYVLEATANYEEALSEYESAAAINNKIPDIHVSLGRIYRILEVYDKAVNSFTIASQLNPNDPTPLLLISRVYYTIGEFGKAEQYALQAVTILPTDPNLRGNLGVIYYKNQKYESAVEELVLVVNGGQDDSGNLVNSLALTGDSIRIPEYYYTYGLALVRTGNCGEALPIFSRIIDTVSAADEISLYNANVGIQMCAEQLNITPTVSAEPTVEITPTP